MKTTRSSVVVCALVVVLSVAGCGGKSDKDKADQGGGGEKAKSNQAGNAQAGNKAKAAGVAKKPAPDKRGTDGKKSTAAPPRKMAEASFVPPGYSNVMVVSGTKLLATPLMKGLPGDIRNTPGPLPIAPKYIQRMIQLIKGPDMSGHETTIVHLNQKLDAATLAPLVEGLEKKSIGGKTYYFEEGVRRRRRFDDKGRDEKGAGERFDRKGGKRIDKKGERFDRKGVERSDKKDERFDRKGGKRSDKKDERFDKKVALGQPGDSSPEFFVAVQPGRGDEFLIPPMATYYDGDRILLHGPEEAIKAVLSGKSDKVLADRLAKMDLEHDVVVLADLTSAANQQQLKQLKSGLPIPPELADLAGLADKLQTVLLTFDAAGPNLLRLDVTLSDADAASKLQSEANKYLGMGRDLWKKHSPELADEIPPAFKSGLAAVNEIIAAAKVEAVGSTVRVTLAVGPSYAKTVADLAPKGWAMMEEEMMGGPGRRSESSAGGVVTGKLLKLRRGAHNIRADRAEREGGVVLEYPAVGPVSGTVTLDGEPLSGANIRLVPFSDGISRFPSGKTDAEGRFRLSMVFGGKVLSGAQPGKYRVTVAARKPSNVDASAGREKSVAEAVEAAKKAYKALSASRGAAPAAEPSLLTHADLADHAKTPLGVTLGAEGGQLKIAITKAGKGTVEVVGRGQK